MVTTETHDDGVGGTRDIEHEYDTAFVNTAGRGWQSFKSHTVTDTVQGTKSITEYSQAFPAAGMPVSIQQRTVSGDKLIRSIAREVDSDALTGSAPSRQFVRVEESTTLEYEVFGEEDGELLRTIVENPFYDSTYGYVTETTRTVTTGAAGPEFVTETDFGRGVNDVETVDLLCLGLPNTVVTSSTLPGGSPVTRTVDYVFNDDCSLDTLTDLSEGSTGKQLVREFAYDGFGNVEAVSEYSVAGGSGTARRTAFTFDADGQFPEEVMIEGVDLTTYLAFDPLLGVRTEVTGPDGLTTSYEYDAFGRLTLEERPAGSTELTYRTCSSCFAPNAAFYVQAEDSTGATSFTFFDAFERPVGSDSPLAGGQRSRGQVRYLANGRVDERSLPYVAGESVHWVTTTYDGLGRPLTEDDEETGITATYEYLGHALEVTDGKSHTTRYEHNALGQIQKVIDAMGGETEYTYYPFGELHTVKDHDDNTTELEYDARGFKTQMDDPDMGVWTYDHNVYGELVEQIDAKSQLTELEYDAAGRLETRYEDEGTTEWEYFPHDAGLGKAGQLKKVTSPDGLIEEYGYTVVGGAVTAMNVLRTIDSVTYALDFDFDDHGRLEKITYPLNVDSQRLAVEYLFDAWGALSQVRNAANTSLVYYTLNAQSGSGAVRRETFGNGVVDQYGYEATTGRLASIQSGPGGSATLQNLALEWDLAGNLEQRVDQRLSRTEVFDYDALNRLETVTRNSSAILDVMYDPLGNIETKTGVSGTYTYGGSRPHAVTAIGSMSFAYDANGNMTDRGADTDITWTSYNLPSRIEHSGGDYSEFLYGADRSRYRQIEGAGVLSSTRHYASPGLFEVLASSSGRVDYHYIHANGRAVAQFTTSDFEADALTYLHRDHQGSVVLTTDTSGDELDRFEYDAFGVRSNPVGSTERTHRGYTGHEHLEALDLIHMNGRVQDPLLGKFLSPDPFVQAPYHSQSLNRYSYVWNNPLSLVDPSGFQGRITDWNRERQEGESDYDPYQDKRLACLLDHWLCKGVPAEQEACCVLVDVGDVPDTAFVFGREVPQNGNGSGNVPQGGIPTPTLDEIAPYILQDPRVRQKLDSEELAEVDAVLIGLGAGIATVDTLTSFQEDVVRNYRTTRINELRQSVRVTKARRLAINRSLLGASAHLARARTLNRVATTGGTAFTGVGIGVALAEAQDGEAGYSKAGALSATAVALYVYPPAGLVATGALLVLEAGGALNDLSLAADSVID